MANTTTVDIQRLVLGRPLNFPVHTESGMLLLGTGQTLTPELRAKLLARGIAQVVVSDVDAASLAPVMTEDPAAIELLESTLNNQIEEFVKQGKTRVRNSGPAVRDTLKKHGKTSYSETNQRTAQRRRTDSVELIGGLMKAVQSGGQLDADTLNLLTGQTVDVLSADFSCALSTVMSTLGNHALAEHSAKMSTLGMAIGIEMGFDADHVRTIGIAGLLADLGMLFVRPEILAAKRRLTPVERLEIHKHCIRSVNIVERLGGLPPLIAMVIYQVHERPDGSGYPRGRMMKAIHPFARILHVADVFAAMTAERPNRARMIGYEAMKQLLQLAQQNKVDPECVRALLKSVSLFPIGSHVMLSDKSTARVIRASGDDYTKPIVLRLTSPAGEPIAADDPDAVLDLTTSDCQIVQALPDAPQRESASHFRRSAAKALSG